MPITSVPEKGQVPEKVGELGGKAKTVEPDSLEPAMQPETPVVNKAPETSKLDMETKPAEIKPEETQKPPVAEVSKEVPPVVPPTTQPEAPEQTKQTVVEQPLPKEENPKKPWWKFWGSKPKPQNQAIVEEGKPEKVEEIPAQTPLEQDIPATESTPDTNLPEEKK